MLACIKGKKGMLRIRMAVAMAHQEPSSIDDLARLLVRAAAI